MPDTDKSILFKEEIFSETEESVNSLNHLAGECIFQDVKQAFSFAEKAYTIAQKLFYRKGIAESASIAAQCHQRFSDYAKALEKALEAMEIFRAEGDKKGESNCLNTLGGVYNYLGDHESRLTCNLRTLQLRQEAGDKDGEIGSLNNIGDTYIKLGNFSKALEYFNRCLAIEHISEKHKTIVTHNMGETYFYMKQYGLAEPYFRNGIELSYKTNYQGINCAGHIFLAEIKIQAGEYDEAMEDLKTAMDVAMKMNAKDEMVAVYKNMSEIFEKKNNLNEAFRYFKLYHQAKEDVYNETKIQQIKNIQFQYQTKGLREETQAERDKNLKLQKAYEQIEIQKNEIAQKNLALTDSIRYASDIQQTILQPVDDIRKTMPESFILFKPKDIVSGDFYWTSQKGDKLIITAADCTGHGVPGAFLSMLGVSLLNEIVNKKEILKPGEILNELRSEVIESLHETGETGRSKDGMDIAVCVINIKTKKIQYAGANNPLYIVRKPPGPLKGENRRADSPFRGLGGGGGLEEINPDKQPVSYYLGKQLPFTNHEIQLQKGDTIYISSDGFQDQFGGLRGKKFMSKRLRELLLEIQKMNMKEQKEYLNKTIEDWKGKLVQVDDILLIGVRI